MLRLRPHHLIDIIRNIGHNRPLVPNPYGHDQHTVTRKIIDHTEQEVMLVVEADDICIPCIHITAAGQCDDILPQLDHKVWKQQYNDDLDRRLLDYFNLKEGTIIHISDFLNMVDRHFEELVKMCTHPKEDEGYRKEGLRRGMKKLK